MKKMVIIAGLLAVSAIFAEDAKIQKGAEKFVLNDNFGTLDQQVWKPTMGVNLGDKCLVISDGAQITLKQKLPKEYVLEAKLSLTPNEGANTWSAMRFDGKIFGIHPDGYAYAVFGKFSARKAIPNFTQGKPVTLTVQRSVANGKYLYQLKANGADILSAEMDNVKDEETLNFWARKSKIHLFSVQIKDEVKK